MPHKIIYLLRSIPLAQETKEAWKNADVPDVAVVFLRRRTVGDKPTFIRTISRLLQGNASLINLGNSEINKDIIDEAGVDSSKVWNLAEWITPILTPGNTRVLFDSLLPPRPTQRDFPADVWSKAPGRAGIGKTRLTINSLNPNLPSSWDVQKHIEGTEYRVITVGGVAVQAFLREGANGDRKYKWVGTKDCPDNIRRTAKTAAQMLIHRNTIIAWDLILDTTGRPYLLEGNSCPGMSVATANRILKQVVAQDNQAEGE